MVVAAVGTPPPLDTRRRPVTVVPIPAGANTMTLSRLQLPPRPDGASHSTTGGPAGDWDLLQLAIREEPDEPAVRRPEREGPTFGSRKRPGRQCGDRSQPELIRGLGSGRRTRRSGHQETPRPAGQLPVPPPAGPPNDVFSGGAMVKRDRRSWGRLAGRPQGDDGGNHHRAERERADGRPRHDASPPGLRRRDDGCTGVIRDTAEQFVDPDARLADVPQPGLGILRQAARQQAPERDRRRGRQGAPVGLLQQDRRQRVGDVVARRRPAGRSASRRARSRTPRCRRACRPACPWPAPAPCRPRCRGSSRASVIAGDVMVGELARFGDPLSPIPDAGSSALASPKSSTFTTPSARTLMLAGLRSRWTIPCSCAASSASAICARSAAPRRAASRPRAIRSRQIVALDQLHHQRAHVSPDCSKP